MAIEPVQLSAGATIVYLSAQDDALATSLCLTGVTLMLLLSDLVTGPAGAVALGFAFAAFIGAAIVAAFVNEEYDHGYGISTIIINGIALAVALFRLATNRNRFETK